MQIDEQILIESVARKRLASTGDRESDEFLRRQFARQRQEAQQQQPPLYPQPSPSAEPQAVGRVEAGSSLASLERELLAYLLKYGHLDFELIEGREVVSCNVAELIFSELDIDDLHLSDARSNQILELYRSLWLEGGIGHEVSMQPFVNHADPEISNFAVDVMTEDDNYTPSQIWRQKDIRVETPEEILSNGLPRAIILFKSKDIERKIAVEQAKLCRSGLSEEEVMETMKHLAELNRIRTTISRKVQRLIL